LFVKDEIKRLKGWDEKRIFSYSITKEIGAC
jgi:hypothetical protein